jgi:lipopolysaccharide export system permease protein
MKIFDKYILKNLAIATAFVSVTLVVVVFLSQSLRFLELVIDSSASSLSFWILTFLALPRFFEIIMPLSMMAATIFIYNRMTMDSEMAALRSAGLSPFALARPALMLAGIVTVFLWCMTLWIAPKALTEMYHMRQIIRSQISTLLFREGVFNQVGDGLTVYIRDRSNNGELQGLMIYDGREKAKRPSTILAKRGDLGSGDGQQVVVYDGVRQEYNPATGKMQRLNFERYTVDLPDTDPIRERWKEPDERTIFELFNPDPANQRDVENHHAFLVEINRRLTAPLLALSFTLMSCAGLLSGSLDRRGQGKRITACVIMATLVQGLYLGSFSLSRHSDWGLPLMYILVLTPLILSYGILKERNEFKNIAGRLLGQP